MLYRSWKQGQTIVEGAYPDRLYIEITNVCNLDCVMCPTGLHVLDRSKGHMRWELFTKVIDEMAPHVKTTTLHIWGEPLLHPKLVDMVRHQGARATPPRTDLSRQELRLLQLLADGFGYDSAGREMGISVNTVRTYVRSIYEKLHVRTKAAAVSRAMRAGLIQ